MIPTTITQTTRMRRPAGMGDSCDAFYRNPGFRLDNEQPYLVRCKCTAVKRVTIQDDLGVYVYKRCAACADILRAQAAKGSTAEILAEEVIK